MNIQWNATCKGANWTVRPDLYLLLVKGAYVQVCEEGAIFFNLKYGYL